MSPWSKFSRGFAAAFAKAEPLDGRDVVLALGLVLVAISLWPFSWQLAVGVPGAVLAAVAILGVR